jgi:four helix bundle suffix protein
MQMLRNRACPAPGAGLIPVHGGYRRLKSFQVAQLVHDITVRFCERYIDRRSRTRDQMVQAARSGTQNIAEGSCASGTSRKFEIKLTSIARASLEELRIDYEDFLRQRALPRWERCDPRRQELIDRRPRGVDEVALWVREVRQRELSTRSTRSTASTYPEISANAALVLIDVACGLLERQIRSLERRFLEEGGFTERLHQARYDFRKRRQKWMVDQVDPSGPGGQ